MDRHIELGRKLLTAERAVVGEQKHALPIRFEPPNAGQKAFEPRQSRWYSYSWPLTTWLARLVVNFDLVHIHALFSYPAVPASFWARRVRQPVHWPLAASAALCSRRSPSR